MSMMETVSPQGTTNSAMAVPVGMYGEGVYQVSNWLTESGHAVETKLYPGYRHEIHNYEDLKDEVVEDIICFFDAQLDFDDDDEDEE